AASLEPARIEAFLGDTAQARFAADSGVSASAARVLRIAEPVDGTIVALDPDIPLDFQRMRLRARNLLGQEVAALWYLDGRELATQDWLPYPGVHVFELRQADGMVLDRARVEVRGGGFPDGRQ
ncbi:MAG TPA: penicillin-binding protein 1C, partial [Castellaniella sp.]|nr:penicillin-binding protein 1C [Castellaniella sp.]